MPDRIVFEDQDAPEPRGRHRGLLRHFTLTAVAVLVMLYVAALAISRTAGFRAYVMERLSARTGLELTAQRARLTAGFALELDSVRSKASGGRSPVALQAARARLVWDLTPGPRWGRIRACTAEDGAIAFAQDAAGTWQPAPLSDAAAWLHAVRIPGLDALLPVAPAAAAPAPTDPERHEEDLAGDRMPDLTLSLQNMDVAWWGAQSNRLALLRDLDLCVTPADLAGRKVVHVRLSAAEFDSTRGGSIRPIAFECLWCGPRRFLLECAVGSPPPDEPGPSPMVPRGRVD